MTFLTIAVIVVGALIAYLIARAPRRTVQLLEKSEAKRARIEGLTALLAQLSEVTESTRVILEHAAQRPDLALQPSETDLLLKIRASCESALPGLEQASPILDRYFKNHIAVISYVLGESDPNASRSDLINNSLESIYRFFAAQRSNDPIAVMERKLATGHSV